MLYAQEVILNVDKPSSKSYYAKQCDNRERVLKIKLFEGSNQIIPQTDEKAVFRFIKPDGNSGMNSANIESDGTITVTLTDQILAVAGNVYCDISLLKGDCVISSCTFSIMVEAVPLSESQLESDSDFLYLKEISGQSKENAAIAQNAANRAEAAANKLSIDEELSNSSTNAVQNKCVTAHVNNPSIYDLDVVQDALNLKNLWNQGRIEIDYRGGDWRYACKDIPIKKGGWYTIYIGCGDLNGAAQNYAAIGFSAVAPSSIGGYYYNFKKLQKVYIDETDHSFNNRLAIKIQASEANEGQHKKYFIDKIMVFEGDITNIPCIPKSLIKDLEKPEKIKGIYDTAQILNNSQILLSESNVKNNHMISFFANLNDFNGRLEIGKTLTKYGANMVEVSYSDVSVYEKTDNIYKVKSFKHNLMFKDYISITIQVSDSHSAKIIVRTNGGEFVVQDVKWEGSAGNIYAGAIDNLYLYNAYLGYRTKAWDFDTWIMGDSYLSFLTPLMIRDGCKNVMYNGFPGATSADAFESVISELKYGSPKNIVWFIGMNDNDLNSVLNESWKQSTQRFVDICKKEGINPVFVTIPNCKGKTVNEPRHNEMKNSWIKNSGYRYIDVCACVGADTNNEWYTGMLSSDGVHPTDEGTKAIASAIYSQFPEIMF